MKNSTQDLLLAVAIRDLAIRRLVEDAPTGLNDVEFRQWKTAHIGRYIKDAVQELDEIADIMKS